MRRPQSACEDGPRPRWTRCARRGNKPRSVTSDAPISRSSNGVPGCHEREAAVKRAFEVRVVVLLAVATALLAGAITYFLLWQQRADNEDRGQIIVRSG